jgi:low temperature requirement protein LtrA
MTPQASRSFLGERGEGLAEVRPIHLLFDLIYVLAITQLTRLVGDLTLRGASETLLRLLAVSEAGTTRAGSPTISTSNTRPVRLMLVGAMLASLILSPPTLLLLGRAGPK